jgi:uncharacterized RDD family membrane protein YckC
MSAPAHSNDPRSVITPEAFHVSPELLGLPLAAPGRRLAAVLVDLVCIGIITAVTRSFALVLGIVVAAALVRAGSLRTRVPGNVYDRARRASIGCLGLSVGLITLVIWAAVAFEDDGDLSELVGRLDQGVAVQERGDLSETAEPRDAEAVRDGVTLYTVEEAVEAYLVLRRSGADTEMDRVLATALEERLATEFASDSLQALEETIAELEEEADDARRELAEVESELEDAGSSGLFSRVRGLLDDLGLGFGWAALYTTVLLSATNGQTLGKRLLGIRVVRLDGQRINWWVAFERAGGYAAGFATGLLGFAQVYWDANRQGIHDRIVGTVVVRDGAGRVQDSKAAL